MLVCLSFLKYLTTVADLRNVEPCIHGGQRCSITVRVLFKWTAHRYLDKASYVAVMRQNFSFLAGMESFNMAGEPIFSDDDHRVTFPIRVIADETRTVVNWAEMDFRLGRVRDGSHKDCWLVERVTVRDSGHDTK
ncbi:unnamed protein product [Ectocarpus sp. 4 AP-2014]